MGLLPNDLENYYKTSSGYSGTRVIDYKFNEFKVKDVKLPKPFEIKEDYPMIEVTKFLNECYFLAGEKPGVAKPAFSDIYINCKVKKCLVIVYESGSTVKIAGVIGLRPIRYILNKKCLDSYQIVFWCVHPTLRNRNLGKVLFRNCAITYLQQEQKMTGMIFENYRSIGSLKCPLVPLRWMTRPLNFDHYRLPKDKANLIKKHCELKPVQLDCMRVLRRSDIMSAMQLYQSKMIENYQCYNVYTANEFEERFLPRKGSVYSYLITNTMGELKDFISFSLIRTQKGLTHGYLTAITYPKESTEVLKVIVTNVLFIAQKLGCDIFFALDQQGIGNTLCKELYFCYTGQICYHYILNYDSLPIPAEKNALNLI